MKIRVITYPVKFLKLFENRCNDLLLLGWELESQQMLASGGEFVLVAFFRKWEEEIDETV